MVQGRDCDWSYGDATFVNEVQWPDHGRGPFGRGGKISKCRFFPYLFYGNKGGCLFFFSSSFWGWVSSWGEESVFWIVVEEEEGGSVMHGFGGWNFCGVFLFGSDCGYHFNGRGSPATGTECLGIPMEVYQIINED